MKKTNITDLLIFVIATELVGALSGILAGRSFAFYKELTQPPFAPPGWVFPVVWTVLYALMGISAYLVYAAEASPTKKGAAYIIYAAQLFVNFLWSIVFFRFRLLGLSVAVILLLLVLIVFMLLIFRKIRPLAALINIPYLLWVLFASYLNIGVLVLN